MAEYLTNLAAIFREAKRVLRPDGLCWIVIGDSYRENKVLFLPARLGMALQEDGWFGHAELIWDKMGVHLPNSFSDRPTQGHETILMMAKSERYFYDGDAIRVPLRHPNTVRARTAFSRQNVSHRAGVVLSNPLGKNASTVWSIPSENGKHSPASFPEELVRRCLAVWCPDGAVVLDPFAGMCTTGLAAARMKHSSIMIDIDAEILKLARKRIRSQL